MIGVLINRCCDRDVVIDWCCVLVIGVVMVVVIELVRWCCDWLVLCLWLLVGVVIGLLVLVLWLCVLVGDGRWVQEEDVILLLFGRVG